MRTLERAWEEKLRALEHLQREYDTRSRPKLLTVTADEQQKILELAQDLPALWQAETTTNQERKQLLRLLLHDVTLKKETTTIHLAIRWQTEAITHLDIEKPRPSPEVRRNKPELIEQVRQLAKRHSDPHIVQILNQQGVRSATGKPFNLSMIQWIRWAYDIPLHCPVSPTTKKIDRRGDGRYSAQAAAEKLNVDISTILHWCKGGKLDGRQEAAHGAWWIKLTPKIIKALRKPFRRRQRSRSRRRGARRHRAR